MASTYALIVAAGRGARFGGELPKQYLPLGGSTVLRHAVAAFATHPQVAGVLVMIRPEDQSHYERAIAGLVVRGPVRVVTALALRRQCFLPRALSLQDREAWSTMREHLTSRREGRRKQLRFRKDPAAYLAALEDILLKIGLPS